MNDATVKTITADSLAKFPPYLVPMKSGTVYQPNFLKYGASSEATSTYPPVQPTSSAI